MSSLVDIISDDLMMPDNHPGYISEAILKYESTFREATLTNFEDDRYGILKLASIFKQEFDPLNDDSSCHAVIRAFDRSAGLLDFLHLDYFLKSDRYLSSVNLRDRNRDAVSHAIVSFGLEWNADSWKSFVERFPNHQRFAKHICEERERTDVFIFGSSVGRVTYVKTTFRVLRNYFVEVNRDEASRPEPSRFELVQLLNWGFVQHLRDVHHMIRWGEGVKNIKMLENPMAIPYDITNSVGAYGQLRNESSAKFITGQACCGKTTLLTRLRQLGWKVLSRGDIGSFSGKAHNAAAVACLHASFEWVLSHSDVLGDRSNIDNALWVGIMQLVETKYQRNLVSHLLDFINASFNEPALAYYIGQRGIVFIDPYPERCADRMIARSTGGDAQRGRLRNYAVTQTMAYYLIARLFGWMVCCVPYDEAGVISSEDYERLVDRVVGEFGLPDRERKPLPSDRFAKPVDDFKINHDYAKSIGIYK